MAGVLESVEAALVEHFAHRPARASVSFVGVEPIEVLRFEPVPGERAYVTLGMSRDPMTGAGEAVRAEDGPRAELVLRVRDATGAYDDMWRKLAVLAAAPAVEGVIYRPGMTVDLGEPVAGLSKCTGVVVGEADLPPVETPAGPVHLLRAVPATTAELAWGRARGGLALLERWAGAGVDLLDPARAPVALG